ncbi:MAG: hypothetical protein ACOX4I_08380 [Anaerovoracaceae bacterium]|jgi:hypothetical protein
MKKMKMINKYLINLALRITVFVGVLFIYIRYRQWMIDFMTQPTRFGFNILHVIWLIFMVIMITHIFPNNSLSMALMKSKRINYEPVKDYSNYELLQFVQRQNLAAWKVMLLWLSMNGVWGILYLMNVIGVAELMLLTCFYFLSDYICILFFCPFQTFIMGNKCCVNCRIYDWGHFMMFTPMLFIRNFFSWSLFFTSCIVLIHWEIIYAQHPEQFWSGSNKTLQCDHCRDKICKFKKLLHTSGKDEEEAS